jgi:heme-degrading monooxygenase HmoA
MMTIVADIRLKEGAEEEWDSAMRERMTAAKKQPGWVGGQLLHRSDESNKRVIVGTWQTRSDWEKWHEDPLFAETRRRLDSLATGPAEHAWHEVVLDVRKAARSGSFPKPGPARGSEPK